jgi:hypothetical protein
MKSDISLQRASRPSDATTPFMLFADGAAVGEPGGPRSGGDGFAAFTTNSLAAGGAKSRMFWDLIFVKETIDRS